MSYGTKDWSEINSGEDDFNVTPEERILIEEYMGNGYHLTKDWNGIMPVIEKINRFIYETTTDHNGGVCNDTAFLRTFGMMLNDGDYMVRINRCALHYDKQLIIATLRAILDFIKQNRPICYNNEYYITHPERKKK